MRSSDYSYLERLLHSLSETSSVDISIEKGGKGLSIGISRYRNRDYSEVTVGEYWQSERGEFAIIRWFSEWTYGDMALVLFPETLPSLDGSWKLVQYPLEELLKALRGVPEWVSQHITKVLLPYGDKIMVYVSFPTTQVKDPETGDVVRYKNNIAWGSDSCLVAEPMTERDMSEMTKDLLRSFMSHGEEVEIEA